RRQLNAASERLIRRVGLRNLRGTTRSPRLPRRHSRQTRACAVRTRARSIPSQLFGIAAAIEIKRIIEMPLAADRFVIVVALCGSEPPEPFRDRLETR